MTGKFTGRGIVGSAAKADLNDWRETWAVAQNKALEAAGSEARVDHRTLEAQGVERVAGTHIGVSAVAMEKKGMATVRGQAGQNTRFVNQVMAALRDVVKFGQVAEVPQFDGLSWWERMLDGAVEVAGAAIDRAVALVKDESGIGGSWVERETAGGRSREVEPDGGFELG